MNRTELLRQLRAHLPFDDRERRMLERITDFVIDREDCTDRNLKIGHLTGSAWVVDRNRSHALLTHHAKLDIWVQLGGHVENDPDMLGAAWREAREESGLIDVRPVSDRVFDVDVHEIPATPKEPAHFHFDIRYLFEADRGAALGVTAESKSLRWVALEKITELTQEESILRMVRKTMRQREYGKDGKNGINGKFT
jgi:ADP-ribose pyrophosphatase YjhB (NUDIX family)